MILLGEVAREIAKAVVIATLSAVGAQAVQWAFEELKREPEEEAKPEIDDETTSS